jgi:hypothetical protein
MNIILFLSKKNKLCFRFFQNTEREREREGEGGRKRVILVHSTSLT